MGSIRPGTWSLQSARIRGLEGHPAAAIVAGDCAFLDGEPGDYRLFGDLLKPLRRPDCRSISPWGSHDHRNRLLAAFPDARAHGVGPPVQGKFVSVVETPHANWFLLDSLDKTGQSKGRLGNAQLKWLGKSLDARADKPALVLAHHNPDRLINIHGLIDTARLFDVLVPRRHVKAYFYGHTHCWQVGHEFEDPPGERAHHRLAVRAGRTAGSVERAASQTAPRLCSTRSILDTPSTAREWTWPGGRRSGERSGHSEPAKNLARAGTSAKILRCISSDRLCRDHLPPPPPSPPRT